MNNDTLIVCSKAAELAGICRSKMDLVSRTPEFNFPAPEKIVYHEKGLRFTRYYSREKILEWLAKTPIKEMPVYPRNRKSANPGILGRPKKESVLITTSVFNNALAQAFIRRPPPDLLLTK